MSLCSYMEVIFKTLNSRGIFKRNSLEKEEIQNIVFDIEKPKNASEHPHGSYFTYKGDIV